MTDRGVTSELRGPGRLFDSLSHDLHTPLNAIIGFSELLADDAFGPLLPQQKENIQHVLHSGRHLLALLDDVLDLARLEAGLLDFSGSWTPVADVIDGVQTLALTQAKARGVPLTMAAAPDLPDLFADAARLTQAVRNLLAHVIATAPADSPLTLAVTRQDRQLQIVVGGGAPVPPDQIEQMFEPLKAGKAGGTGLGLALVRGLAALHGGTVAVVSEPGRASTWTLRLPLVRTLPGPPAQTARDEHQVLVLTRDLARAERMVTHLRTLGLSPALSSQTTGRILAAVVATGPRDDVAGMLAAARATDPQRPVILTVQAATMPPDSRSVCLRTPVARDDLATALASLGVPMTRLEGCTVALDLAPGAAAMAVRATLRASGAVLVAADAPAEITLLDAEDAMPGPHTLRCVVDDGAPVPPGALAWPDVLTAERLVRAIAALR